MDEIFDVIIIGGGPAGLSAALMLGRCCRRVLLCDDGHYRNAYAHSIHGYLTRDGINPEEFRNIALEQLKPYNTVQLRKIKIIDAKKEKDYFVVLTEEQQSISAKKLLLATGLSDNWPAIEGAKELYGTSIFHCPYCDAWELRNQPFAAYGKGDKRGAKFALELKGWSKNIILCTDGPSEISSEYLQLLAKHQIPIREEKIMRFEGKNGILEKIVFENGDFISRRAVFFNTKSSQRSLLATKLGCEFDEDGSIKVGKFETTNIPGLFAAGDASRDVLQVVVAASEGVEAAVAINNLLLKKELE